MIKVKQLNLNKHLSIVIVLQNHSIRHNGQKIFVLRDVLVKIFVVVILGFVNGIEIDDLL